MESRTVLLGVGVLFGVAVFGILGTLLTAPEAQPSNADEVFDTPVVEDGGACFRVESSRGSSVFVASIDATSPDRTTRYFKSASSITRFDHYPGNDTTVSTYNFVGDRAESRYRSRVDRIEGNADDNETVVTDDDSYRIRVVDRNASASGPQRLNILHPALSVLRWKPVNDTAYRPVGGWVESDRIGGENTTSHVSAVDGVARTDGNGSIRSVDVTYRTIADVDYRIEPLFKDGDPVALSFDREPCMPTPVQPPE